jgi:hypothetical protein
VFADVVTFLTQAAGGGMAATGGDLAKTGDHVSSSEARDTVHWRIWWTDHGIASGTCSPSR